MKKNYYFPLISKMVVNEPEAAYFKENTFSGIAIWEDLLIKARISRAGIRKEFYEMLKKNYAMTNDQFQNVFAITWKSIQNRHRDELISGHATDRAINLMALWDEGLDFFEEEQRFIDWLNASNSFFNDNTPMSVLDTPAGVEMVKRKIGQLKHGITA